MKRSFGLFRFLSSFISHQSNRSVLCQNQSKDVCLVLPFRFSTLFHSIILIYGTVPGDSFAHNYIKLDNRVALDISDIC